MASIVVVGGGAAGLVCAWRLQRAGHDVEVSLEWSLLDSYTGLILPLESLIFLVFY